VDETGEREREEKRACIYTGTELQPKDIQRRQQMVYLFMKLRIRRVVVDWTQLAENCGQGRDLENTALNFLVP
jgi:hypothetical protein